MKNKFYYTYMIYCNEPSSSMYGCIYYGKHITSNLLDGYIASGKKIRNYIKKYPNGYYRKILGLYNSEEELNKAEYNLIHPHLGKCYCLNLREGGDGVWNCTLEVRQQMSKTRKERIKSGEITTWNKGISWDEDIRNKISETLKEKYNIGEKVVWNKGKHNVQTPPMSGRNHSSKSKNQISESQKKRFLDPNNHIPPANKNKHRVYDNKELNIYHYE